VLTLKQLARHKKPIIFYDIYGYYNKLMDFMEYAAKERFIRENCKLLYQCTDDDAELIEYLENTDIADFTVHDMKQG
jgi:predicted Rossmann-fold nucleotide-binding protein